MLNEINQRKRLIWLGGGSFNSSPKRNLHISNSSLPSCYELPQSHAFAHGPSNKKVICLKEWNGERRKERLRPGFVGAHTYKGKEKKNHIQIILSTENVNKSVLLLLRASKSISLARPSSLSLHRFSFSHILWLFVSFLRCFFGCWSVIVAVFLCIL